MTEPPTPARPPPFIQCPQAVQTGTNASELAQLWALWQTAFLLPSSPSPEKMYQECSSIRGSLPDFLPALGTVRHTFLVAFLIPHFPSCPFTSPAAPLLLFMNSSCSAWLLSWEPQGPHSRLLALSVLFWSPSSNSFSSPSVS